MAGRVAVGLAIGALARRGAAVGFAIGPLAMREDGGFAVAVVRGWKCRGATCVDGRGVLWATR